MHKLSKWVSAAVVMFGVSCGRVEEEGATEPVASIQQAEKTGQEKTGQGATVTGASLKTDGKTLVIRPLNWRVRSGISRSGIPIYATGSADVFTRADLARVTRITKSDGTTLEVPIVSAAQDQLDEGNGFSMGPGSLASFKGVAISDDGFYFGNQYDMRIVNSWVDTGPAFAGDAQLLLSAPYRSQIPNNLDLRLYKLQVLVGSTWSNYCNAPGQNGRGMFIPGRFTLSGTYTPNVPGPDHQQYLSFVCADGTASKCMRWGYRPWRKLNAIDLNPLWQACIRAASADYCATGEGMTFTNASIDLWDRYGFIQRSPESVAWFDTWNPDALTGLAGAFSDESTFDGNGATCLVRERLAAISGAAASCPVFTSLATGSENCFLQDPTSGTWSSCGPKGVYTSTTNVFDRGDISQCDTLTRKPLIYVSSFLSGCADPINNQHTPFDQGRSLAMDCNTITAAVCKSTVALTHGQHPWRQCCAEDQNGRTIRDLWDQQCVDRAYVVYREQTGTEYGGHNANP